MGSSIDPTDNRGGATAVLDATADARAGKVLAGALFSKISIGSSLVPANGLAGATDALDTTGVTDVLDRASGRAGEVLTGTLFSKKSIGSSLVPGNERAGTTGVLEDTTGDGRAGEVGAGFSFVPTDGLEGTAADIHATPDGRERAVGVGILLSSSIKQMASSADDPSDSRAGNVCRFDREGDWGGSSCSSSEESKSSINSNGCCLFLVDAGKLLPSPLWGLLLDATARGMGSFLFDGGSIFVVSLAAFCLEAFVVPFTKSFSFPRKSQKYFQKRRLQ